MNSIYRQVKHSGVAAIALTMLAVVILLAGIAIPVQAQTETVLYSFQGTPSSGRDGAYPQSGPILKGTTLYGTASQGVSAGCGIVWAVSTTTGKETILYTFQGEPYDAWRPMGGLTYYKGSFYGTTVDGQPDPWADPERFSRSPRVVEYVEKILFVLNTTYGAHRRRHSRLRLAGQSLRNDHRRRKPWQRYGVQAGAGRHGNRAPQLQLQQ